MRCEYIAADLTKTDKVEELCQSVDQMFPDGIDILINNAGGSNVGLTQFNYFTLEVLSILTYVTFTRMHHIQCKKFKHFLDDMLPKAFNMTLLLVPSHFSTIDI